MINDIRKSDEKRLELLEKWYNIKKYDYKTQDMLFKLMDSEEQLQMRSIEMEMMMRLDPKFCPWIAHENDDGTIRIKAIKR